MNALYACTFTSMELSLRGVGHSGLDYMHFELSRFDYLLLRTLHAPRSWPEQWLP